MADPNFRGIPECAASATVCKPSSDLPDVGGTFSGCIDVGAFLRDSSGRMIGRRFHDDPSQGNAPLYLYRRTGDGRLSVRNFPCSTDGELGTTRGGLFREHRQVVASVGSQTMQPTATMFNTSLADHFDGCWDGWRIRFMDGQNRNQWRGVVAFSNPSLDGSAVITLDAQLPVAPSAGDTFKLQRVQRTPLRPRVPFRNRIVVPASKLSFPTFDGRAYRVFKTYRFNLDRDSITGTQSPGTPTWDPTGSAPPTSLDQIPWFPDRFFDPVYDLGEKLGFHMAYDDSTYQGEFYSADGGIVSSNNPTNCFIENNPSLEINWALAGVHAQIVAPHLGSFDDNGTLVAGADIQLAFSVRFVGFDVSAGAPVPPEPKSFPTVGQTQTDWIVAWGAELAFSGNSSVMEHLNAVGDIVPNDKRYETPCSLMQGDICSTGALFNPPAHRIDYTAKGSIA